MLKVLSYSCRFQNVFASHSRASAITRNSTESTTPLLRVLNSLRGSNHFNSCVYRRAFFCSDSSSSDGSDSVVDGGPVAKSATGEAEDADSKSSNSILPSVFRPEECFTVLALPLPHRPLFPGFYMPVYVKDPKLLAALAESQRRQAPYAGAFLVKDEADSDTEKNINDLKGKELLNRLHEVGTLAQITSIQGEQVVLIGHRRLRITEMVNEDPLTVKVDHLKDLPYDKDDDVIKATSFEVIYTVSDVLQSSLWRDHAQTYTKVTIHKEKEEKNFSKGSLVEVSSDEDGFEGAWFTATVLKSLVTQNI